MDFLQRYKKLCTPAAIYFTISALSLIIIGLQNISNPGRLCLGTYDCPAPGSNNIIVFIVQAIYILLVTYILNLICKDNNERLSWFLVLFPIILMFIFYGITMMQMNSTKEGLEGLEDGLVEEYDSEGEGDDSGPVGDEDDDDNEILTAKFDDLDVEGFEGMSSPDNSEAQNQLNEMANELKELQADVLGFESFESSKTEEPGIGHHEGLILEGNEDKDERIKELEQENQQLQVDVDTAEQETIVAEGETAAAEQETAAAEAETLRAEAELETAETETEAAEAAEKIANDQMTSAMADSVSGFEPMGADANIFG